MLTTLLENQVKGGKWHTLIDKVHDPLNLAFATFQVVHNKGAAGVDRQTVEQFIQQMEAELQRLGAELKAGEYRPAPVRRTWIPKPGSTEERPLGIPTVRDRVVQTALVNVIEPILDHQFHERSYGFRHQRGCHDALRRVEKLLEAGHVYVVDADLKSYFDTIPKDKLLDLVRQHISDGRVLGLIEMYLQQGILEEMRLWTPEAGVPQGAVLSPLLANLYLNPFDHLMAELGYEMVRYADDFVVLCRTAEEAESALQVIRQWVTDHGLTLHPTKTKIVDFRKTSFAFLGYSFREKFRFPRAKSHEKFVERIRQFTPRHSGDSLDQTIQRLNRSLKGWFNYFRHCHWTVFDSYDKLIRTRLRRMLLKRQKRNPQRQSRNHRWPNAYFAEQGLYSLCAAQLRFASTPQGNY